MASLGHFAKSRLIWPVACPHNCVQPIITAAAPADAATADVADPALLCCYVLAVIGLLGPGVQFAQNIFSSCLQKGDILYSPQVVVHFDEIFAKILMKYRITS